MTAMTTPIGPTLEEVRRWPATVSVEDAAAALGISRAHAYDLIKAKEFPAKALSVGRRIRVTTSSILAVIDEATSDRPQVA
uniref:helix-turn-helix domain-containing protein n=1 Tax=Paractinoplanes polyasparticus TaxID=2856853 RepID=UPI001C845673|nr:helix-turn-helix domain-containing protein [Actinoplanes polyasparticus]